MTAMLSLVLALMLSIGGSPAGGPGNTGIQGPIDNSCTINRIFEDYSQKTASRLFPKKIPEIVLIDQPKTQIRLMFTPPLKEKPLLMGYEDSMNLYQAFNMNPVNFTDPFGKDVLGACAESNKYYLYPTENKEIIEAKNRALALFGEGAANAAVKTFLLPAKYITLPARLMFGFDFDLSLNFTEEGSVVNAGIGKRSRKDVIKEQTVVYPLADFVTQTGYDAYFGLSYQGGNSSLGKYSRENLARSAGALEFNMLFWGKMYSKMKAESPNSVQPVDSVWKKGPGPRGEAIEKMLGQNLPQNFPTIDRFKNGIATSIKSIDLTLKTYNNPKSLLRLLENYVNQVKNFQGVRWGGFQISSSKIQGRALDIAIPRGVATAEQNSIFYKIINYGKQNGVTVKIREVD